MKIKDGAILSGLDIHVRPILIIAERIWKSYGQELVITSGLDGAHSAGSLHYYGLAVDLRTHYFTAPEVEAIAKELQTALGSNFDVFVHSTHIHAEYDPK